MSLKNRASTSTHSPPQLHALPVGGDVRLKDLHFETYNDPNVLVRLLVFCFLLLVFLASVYFFLSDSASSSQPTTPSIRDIIFLNYRTIVGVLLLFWYTAWCFISWLWRIWRPNEDGDGVAQRCALGCEKLEGTGIICWVPGSDGWELRIATLD